MPIISQSDTNEKILLQLAIRGGQKGDNWTPHEDKLVRRFLFLLSTVSSAQMEQSRRVLSDLSHAACNTSAILEMHYFNCWVQKRGGVECLVLGCNHNWRLPACELSDPLRYTSSRLWKNIYFKGKSENTYEEEKIFNCVAMITGFPPQGG